MQKKYSIGLLVGIIILFVLFFFAYRISYQHALDKHEAEAKEQVQGEAEVCFYIMELDGYVTVYEGDKTTVYEYTTIRVEDLPEYLQEDVREGLKVTSLRQVYGFLENYSS